MPKIETPESKILVYGLADGSAERNRLKELANAKGIQLVTVEKKDFNQKLGYLANLDKFEAIDGEYQGEDPSHSIIWFVGIEQDDLGSILQDYSTTEGIKPIDLKAVLTEYNVNWPINEHYEELQREHRMMNAYTFLFHAQKAVDSLDPKDYTEESYAKLKKVVEDSIPDYLSIQQGVEIEQEVLDEHVYKIRSAYKGLLPNVDN